MSPPLHSHPKVLEAHWEGMWRRHVTPRALGAKATKDSSENGYDSEPESWTLAHDQHPWEGMWRRGPEGRDRDGTVLTRFEGISSLLAPSSRCPKTEGGCTELRRNWGAFTLNSALTA